MKLLKQILPFLLAAIIIAGGFFGIYGMEMLIPNEKDKIVRSDKRAANQLLYVEEGETLTIYPWDHYDPDALLTLKQYGIEYGIEADSSGFTEYAYRLDTFLYQIFSDGNETESPGQIVTNIEGFHFFESVQDLFESMEVTQAGDFCFLKDKTCNAVWNRTEYRLDVALSIFLGNGNLPICYLHLVPVNRDPVSKEQMQKASENWKPCTVKLFPFTMSSSRPLAPGSMRMEKMRLWKMKTATAARILRGNCIWKRPQMRIC